MSNKTKLTTKDKTSNFKRSCQDLDRSSDTENDSVNSLDALLSKMRSLFEDTNAKIDSNATEIRGEIVSLRQETLQMQQETAKRMDKLTNYCGELKAATERNQNFAERLEKANDLLLFGVPFIAQEDLSLFVAKIAAILGYGEQQPLVYTKRIAKTPIAAGSSPPILFQFAFRAARDDFFFRYLANRNLTLANLGFQVATRIYFNENLTYLAREIKGRTLKLKKAGNLHSVFTKSGTVFIKKSADGTAKPVHTLEQLGATVEQ